MKPISPLRPFSLRTALILSAALFTVSAFAQIAPGEYVGEQGYSQLRVRAAAGGAQAFKLMSRGANYHFCELEGAIRNGEARLPESADDKKPCVVTFKILAKGIEVGEKNEGACRTYCGMRAYFGGLHELPPKGCAASEIAGQRKAFKAAYDKKEFARARDTLAPVLNDCKRFLVSTDEGWVRNDLALAEHRAGDSAACRTILKGWVELAQTNDQEIKEGYPPSDAEDFLRLAKATRTNLKLCGAPVTVNAAPNK